MTEIKRKKIIAVNAGPRMGWNTETLITEASKGAEQAGAEVKRYDLYRLEKYAGCISCLLKNEIIGGMSCLLKN